MKTWFVSRGSVLAALLLLFSLIVSPALAVDLPPGESVTGTQADGGAGIAGAAPSSSVLGSSTQSSGTLLADHFGVTLALQANTGGANGWSFDWDSFKPTKNVNTVDWIEADWYGNWNTSDFSTSTVRGYLPSGGEWYDVEALYFDNDDQNFYIAIVTSVPFTNTAGGGSVGIYESRISGGYWVRPGDLSIDLGLDTARVERYGTWHYNYGLDLVHDDRNAEQALHDSTLGKSLYKTQSDAGGSDVENPTGSDWYTSGPSHNVTAGWEHTNLDPIYSSLTSLGAATVDYYRYDFTGGYLENNAETWVIEATIPRSLFGADNPGDGDWVGIRWVEGCRNDGNDEKAVIYLKGDVDYPETGDAPDSSNHFSTAMSYDGNGNGTGNFPTVADAGLGEPYGMCHLILPNGARLGKTVSAERDADLSPDQDAPTFPNNLIPSSDVNDLDTDDGLLLPGQWRDGIQTTIQYTVTVPITGVARTRYVNVWFDWNRDGDWGDAGVACRTSGLSADEHAVVNRAVSVAPGSSQSFTETITPCNPAPYADDDAVWVRITLSDEPVQSRNVRDGFHNYSYGNNEGTNDWANDWQEEGENGQAGPAGGEVRLDNGRLCIGPQDGTHAGAWRRVDLSSAASATLSFDYEATTNNTSDVVGVQVSTDGGGSWVTVGTFAGSVSGSFSYDLSSYMAADTDIRLVAVQNYADANDVFCADNIQVAFSTGLEDGRGPGYCYADGETEDWYFTPQTPTNVEIASFTASAYPNAVLLEWQSATEFDTLGYRLERADAPAGPWSPLPEGSYAAQAPGGLGAAYEHSDWDVKTGRTYYYRLVMIGTSGTESYFGPVSATVPTIGEPLAPPSPAGVHRVFLPFISK